MMMEKLDFEFLSQADEVTLKLEKAKRALDLAKQELESAKQDYEQLFSQAEEHGFQRARLKKMTEERAQAILEFIATPAKTDKPKKAKKKEVVHSDHSEDFESELVSEASFLV